MCGPTSRLCRNPGRTTLLPHRKQCLFETESSSSPCPRVSSPISQTEPLKWPPQKKKQPPLCKLGMSHLKIQRKNGHQMSESLEFFHGVFLWPSCRTARNSSLKRYEEGMAILASAQISSRGLHFSEALCSQLRVLFIRSFLYLLLGFICWLWCGGWAPGSQASTQHGALSQLELFFIHGGEPAVLSFNGYFCSWNLRSDSFDLYSQAKEERSLAQEPECVQWPLHAQLLIV